MADTKTAGAPPDLKTPEPDAPKGVHPKKGRRFRIWEDGDYCIYLAAAPDSGMPAGSLIPVADAPHFASKREADEYIANSGDTFSGKGLYVLRVFDILKMEVEMKPQMTIHRKPKIQVAGPKADG